VDHDRRGQPDAPGEGRWMLEVDNVVIRARFIHRDNQWLAVLSSELDGNGAGARLDSFLDGLTLLP
jgi:hypothetical protein